MDEPLQGEFSYRVVNEGKAVSDSFLIRARTGIEALIKKQKNWVDPLFSAIAASVATFKSMIDSTGFVGFGSPYFYAGIATGVIAIYQIAKIVKALDGSAKHDELTLEEINKLLAQ